jgi:hypothetical protein
MATPVEIKDGTGTNFKAKVTRDHALLVTGIDKSGFDTNDSVLTRYKLFRGFLKNNGSKNLNVNGSVTPVEFNVTSEPGKVLYVSQLRVLLNGTYFEMNTNDFRRFGAATAGGGSLTNGISLVAKQGGLSTPLFADPIKQSGDFFNYADDFVNLVNAVTAQSDFLSFDLHFEQPVVLPEAVSDSVIMTISDDLTAIDLFQVAVRGWQEVK